MTARQVFRLARRLPGLRLRVSAGFRPASPGAEYLSAGVQHGPARGVKPACVPPSPPARRAGPRGWRSPDHSGTVPTSHARVQHADFWTDPPASRPRVAPATGSPRPPGGMRRKREPGGNPGLPRSGEWERPPSYALDPSGSGKRRPVGAGPSDRRARESEDLPVARARSTAHGFPVTSWAGRRAPRTDRSRSRTGRTRSRRSARSGTPSRLRPVTGPMETRSRRRVP